MIIQTIKQEIKNCVKRVYDIDVQPTDFDVWYDSERGVYSTNIAFKLIKQIN